MPVANGALARLVVAEAEIARLRDKTDRLNDRDARREAEVNDIKSDITRLEEALRNNTRALWALLATIVLASLTISASVLVALHG